jgi:hypothetical protein
MGELEFNKVEEKKLVKLYEVPRYSRIKIGNQELNFHHIDGMYSYCVNDHGKLFSIEANTEVKFICSMKEHDLKQLK